MNGKSWATVLTSTGIAALALLGIITVATHRIPRSFVSVLLLTGGITLLVAAWYKRAEGEEGE